MQSPLNDKSTVPQFDVKILGIKTIIWIGVMLSPFLSF